MVVGINQEIMQHLYLLKLLDINSIKILDQILNRYGETLKISEWQELTHLNREQWREGIERLLQFGILRKLDTLPEKVGSK